MAKTSTLRPIDEWEMAPNRSQTQSGSMSQNGMDRPCSRPETLRECAGA